MNDDARQARSDQHRAWLTKAMPDIASLARDAYPVCRCGAVLCQVVSEAGRERFHVSGYGMAEEAAADIWAYNPEDQIVVVIRDGNCGTSVKLINDTSRGNPP